MICFKHFHKSYFHPSSSHKLLFFGWTFKFMPVRNVVYGAYDIGMDTISIDLHVFFKFIKTFHFVTSLLNDCNTKREVIQERMMFVREKEAFRDNLERIIEAFPGQEFIRTKQLARWLHMDPRTVEKRFPVKPGLGISIATLARWMS